MRLQQLQIKNFRCFDLKVLHFSDTMVLIDGLNGSGKTSLLEALHYLCYLRSFRTHVPRELLRFGQDTFFLKVSFIGSDDQEVELQVGFSGKKRSVKINQKAVHSYKELMEHYRIVTLTEDDLLLIQGSPQERRSFIDLVLLLDNEHFATAARTLRSVVQSRNMLLQRGNADKTLYTILTEQLWNASHAVQTQRQQVLALLQEETNQVIATYFSEPLELLFKYQKKSSEGYDSLAAFLQAHPELYYDELRYRRSLFGAHLDDFEVVFQDKRSRAFASRGQQKLIVLLLKIAQMRLLSKKRGSAIFLLDDFMTDFDENRAHILLTILANLGNQVIFTSPLKGGVLHEKLLEIGATVTSLTP